MRPFTFDAWKAKAASGIIAERFILSLISGIRTALPLKMMSNGRYDEFFPLDTLESFLLFFRHGELMRPV